MKRYPNVLAIGAVLLSAVCFACTRQATPDTAANVQTTATDSNATPAPQPSPSSSPKPPGLQDKLLTDLKRTTDSPIGKFDFKNFKYPLPRGWQDSDGAEAELTNGRRQFTMTDEVQRIGLSFVGIAFADATGDGRDEAVIILKIETGGSANPQLAYIYDWKDNAPNLIWNFRTGDRADGGLRRIAVDNGEMIVELYGMDRYIVGELDTAKITGDEEQLCCPTHWTRSRYKWNGNNFRLQGKRLTFEVANPDSPPVENMIEAVNKQTSGKK